MTPDSDSASASASQANSSPVTQIRLVSLNCWGLLFISDLRTPRLAEIGRQLALLDPPPDIVCLQECWTRDDYRAICRATAHILPHGKFYNSGAFGGGLALLSRWPVESSSMVRYPLNGRPTAFWRGDWYVGKGVAAAGVRFGPGEDDVVEVFNTHVSCDVILILVTQILTITRLTPPTKAALTTPTSATAPPRPGKSPSCSAPPPARAAWSSPSATST